MEKARILIVDEDAPGTSYDEFKQLLDYECQFVQKVDMALRLIATNPPDLIVGDIPNTPGSEKIVDLAEKFNIPLIFASKFKNFSFQNMPKTARILNKPFRSIDLMFAVRSELAKKEAKAIPR